MLLTIRLQREKKNLQDLNGVFVFNVADRDYLDRPTARLIKEFDDIEGKSGLKFLLCFENGSCLVKGTNTLTC